MTERLAKRVTHREFLKMCGAAAATVGASQFVLAPKEAQAAPLGRPLAKDETINGNLFVTGNVGIGTMTPAGKLDVAGTVYVNGVAAIGTDAVAKQCYYAP